MKLDTKDFGDRKGNMIKSYNFKVLKNKPQVESCGEVKYSSKICFYHCVLTVFVQLACAFRYGSEDLDVMGLCFRKDIWIQHFQIYPESHKPTLSAMHDTLLKKAGDDAKPFSFEVCKMLRHKCKEFQISSTH